MTVPVRREEKQERSLSDIFNQFAQETIHHFPHLKGHFLIMEMNEDKSYGHEDIDPEKTGLKPETAHAFLKRCAVTRKMKKANEKGADTTSEARINKRRKLHLIFANERLSKEEIGSVPLDKEKLILNTLDHELAHIAIKDAYFNTSDQHTITIGEAIADAYALIRSYQRYGVEDEPHTSLDSWMRVKYLAFGGDVDHFSSFMLDEISRRKDLIDFDSLTSQQTADLAWRFAMQFTPPVHVTEALHKKFAPMRNAYNKNTKSDKWLKILANMVLDPANDYFTFKACRRLLLGYLDGIAEPGDTPVTFRMAQGPYWDDIRQKVKEKDAWFTKHDILFDVPVFPAANENKTTSSPLPAATFSDNSYFTLSFSSLLRFYSEKQKALPSLPPRP